MTARTMSGAAAAAMLTLAACGQAPQQAATAAAPEDGGYLQKLKALSDDQRNSVFFKAIAADHGACPEAKKSVYQQMYKNMAMWTVDCALTGEWSVFVNDAGFAQTRICGQNKQIGLPECKPI